MGLYLDSGDRPEMSGRTQKLEGWAPQSQPPENDEVKAHRQMAIEIVYGLYWRKMQLLKSMGMPPQPVSLSEIWAEFVSRRLTRQSIKDWKWHQHEKRYLDRRVNEAACPTFYEKGKPKIIAASAGIYLPNLEETEI